MIVLHLLTRDAWDAFGPDEPVTAPSLQTEGFIHCTGTHDVLLTVANAFYTQVPGEFVVLHVDTGALSVPCVWEAPAHPGAADTPPAADRFPHVYGPIDRCAIIAMQTIERDSDGRFTGYGTVVSLDRIGRGDR